jgi:cytochrome c-type biogenesis protein CcmE
MRYARTKLIVAGLLVVAAVTLLAVAGIRQGLVYYYQLDDFMQLDEDVTARRVKLQGTVATEGLVMDETMLVVRFTLKGETTELPVDFTGVVPEMFRAGADVVIEGRLGENGVFVADTLMTKCASKYESADGEAPHGDRRALGES